MDFFKHFFKCVVIVVCLWTIVMQIFMFWFSYFSQDVGRSCLLSICENVLPYLCAILCCGYVVYECVKKMLNDLRNKDKNGK